MGSGITMRRAPHEWPACWLRATFPVVLGLGGLAGCALLTEVATPELGPSLDSVRQEVAQLADRNGAAGRLVPRGWRTGSGPAMPSSCSSMPPLRSSASGCRCWRKTRPS